MTGKVYLAGPILHQENYGREWREWLKEEGAPDGIEWLDPMDTVDNTDRHHSMWDVDEIVETDMRELERCAAVLVNWDAVPTAGTPMEIFYASHDLDIPVIVRTQLGPGEVSPWIKYHATHIFYTWESAIKAAAEYGSCPTNQTRLKY